MVTVALSSLSPVFLNYGLDTNMVLNSRIIQFNNNFELFSLDVLTGYIDVAINKDNLLFLTCSQSLADVTDNLGNIELLPETFIGSTTFVTSNGLTWQTGASVLGTGDDELIQTQDLFFILVDGTDSVSATNVGNIFYIDITGGLISIHDAFNQYLTFSPNTLNVTFSAKLVPDNDNYQHFGYLIDGISLVLFTVVPSLSAAQRTIFFDTTSGMLSSGPAVSISNPITPDHVFTVSGMINSGFNDFDAVQSNWVGYDDVDQSIQIDAGKSVKHTEHALLISTPFKSINGDVMDININNLKNYQTPEYGYILDGSNPYGRQYNRLITGVNQEDGYENMFLTFDSNTQEVRFAKDKFTYFHFSPLTTTHSLSASTLINSGAVAGHTPWTSDKVFKKQANYKKYSNWGNASIQDGTLFCSWLSGNDDALVKPVWMDRYFDPTRTSGTPVGLQFSLLTAIANDLIVDDSNPIIWDVTSTMTFEPGVLYIYHHIGETRNSEIVTNIDAGGDLIAKYLQWGSNEDNIIVDSIGNFNGVINNFALSANQTTIPNITNTLYNVGDTYGFIDKVDNIFSNEELTFSFVANVDDWRNVIGDQIFGNYYNGGFGIFNNNPILTPYLTLFDSTAGYVFTLNTKYDVISKTVFVPHNNGIPHIIFRTGSDSEYYIIDSNQNLLGYDVENILQNLIPLATLIGGISATQLEVDADTNFHVVDSVAHMYYKISNAGVLLSSQSIGVADNFALDFNGVPKFPIVGGVLGATVNSAGDFYYITNTYLYRDHTIIYQATSMETILCDDKDNIWITYNKNSIGKLDVNNVLAMNTSIPVTSTATGKRSLSFCKELNTDGLNEFLVLFDSRTQYAHKLTPTGQFTDSTPISSFPGSLIPLSGIELHGVADNGFNYQRRFVAPSMIIPGISVKTFLREQHVNGGTIKKSIQASTADLYGPQQITVTFNGANGSLKLYISGKLVATTSFDAFKYKISSNQNILSLIIGSNAGKRDVLVTELDQPGFYTFHGVIGDLRIYGKELDNKDILAISENSKTVAFDDLIWNMPVGSRNYVEEIERFFKHKMPGNKSQFFDIKLSGLNITDSTVRNLIESSIKSVLTKINPVHASLRNIVWE